MYLDGHCKTKISTSSLFYTLLHFKKNLPQLPGTDITRNLPLETFAVYTTTAYPVKFVPSLKYSPIFQNFLCISLFEVNWKLALISMF